MKSIGQKVGGRFRAQPRDPVTGHRRSITASTQAELEMRLRRIRQTREGLRYGELSVADAQKTLRQTVGLGIRVEDVWNRYRATVRTPSHSNADLAWRYRIAPFLGGKLAVDLDEGTVAEWITKLESTAGGRNGTYYAPKTIELAFSMLLAAYRQAVSARLIESVPWGAWRPRIGKDPRYAREAARSYEELLSLFAVARAHDSKAWDRGHYSAAFFVVVVLGLTGMRQGEACGLSWADVDFGRGVLYIRHQAPKHWRKRYNGPSPKIPTKGKKARKHAMHPSVITVLQFQREQLRKFGWYRDDGPVFPGHDGAWRDAGFAIKPELFRALVRRAGLENPDMWSPHSLRHSCATLEAEATGGDWQWVRARTGHSDLKILEGYIQRTGRGLAVSKLPELPAAMLGGAGSEIVVPADAEPLPLPEPDPVTQLAAMPWDAPDERDERRQEARATFDVLAVRWLAEGRPGVRPVAATAAIRRAYVRGYQRARMAGLALDEARKAGQRARRAALGAWGKAVSVATGKDTAPEVSP